MLITGICLLVILLIGLCWAYCAKDRKDVPYYECDTGRKIIAREVRPGLIVVQNCQHSDETLQIIKEYDSMVEEAMPLHTVPQYGGITNHAADTSDNTDTYIQAGGPSCFSNVRSQRSTGSYTNETLIDLEVEEGSRQDRLPDSPTTDTPLLHAV